MPKQPALGDHSSSLPSTSPPISGGGASSERGQQPSSAEVEVTLVGGREGQGEGDGGERGVKGRGGWRGEGDGEERVVHTVSLLM